MGSSWLGDAFSRQSGQIAAEFDRALRDQLADLLEVAPSYVDVSPLGLPERVHVITTLEDSR